MVRMLKVAYSKAEHIREYSHSVPLSCELLSEKIKGDQK
jgi:hypothetical protein